MSPARSRVLILALIVVLILVWIWIRAPGAGGEPSKAASDAEAGVSAADGSERPASAPPIETELARSTAAPSAEGTAAASSEGETEGVWIRGALAFEGEATYPGPLSRVQVLTDAPVLEGSSTRLLSVGFGAAMQEVAFIPVDEDGAFAFRVLAGTETVTLSALGPSCVAGEDVRATPDAAASVPMRFLYRGSCSVVDAESGLPTKETTNLGMESGGVGFGCIEPGRGGVRSPLALRCIRQLTPLPAEATSIPLSFTVPKPYPEGLPVQVVARVPGYEQVVSTVLLPGYAEEVPPLRIELRNVATVRCDVRLTIERAGDWSGTESLEYRSIAALTLDSADPEAERLGAVADLRPGVHLLRGIPYLEPRLWFEPEAQARKRDSPKPWMVPLEPPSRPGEPYTGTLSLPELCAARISPHDAATEYSFFGLVRHADAHRFTRRYSPHQGYVLDGLRAERHRAYWGSSLHDVQVRAEGGLAHLDFTLLPGLNDLQPPE